MDKEVYALAGAAIATAFGTVALYLGINGAVLNGVFGILGAVVGWIIGKKEA